MALADILDRFFSRPAKERAGETPEDLCVNCWGYQEYDGQIVEVMKDRQVEVNNHRERYAFIQAFAVTHVDGIRLRNSDKGRVCPSCGKVALSS